MPNSRKLGKKKVGLWLYSQQIERLKQIAEENNMSISDLIKASIEMYEKTQNPKGNKNEKKS